MKHTRTALTLIALLCAAVILTTPAAAYQPSQPTTGESRTPAHEPTPAAVFLPLVVKGDETRPDAPADVDTDTPALILVTPPDVVPDVAPQIETLAPCGQYSTAGPHPCPGGIDNGANNGYDDLATPNPTPDPKGR